MDVGHEANRVTQVSDGLSLMGVAHELVRQQVVGETIRVILSRWCGAGSGVPGDTEHNRHSIEIIDERCQRQLHHGGVTARIGDSPGSGDLLSVELGETVDPRVIEAVV